MSKTQKKSRPKPSAPKKAPQPVLSGKQARQADNVKILGDLRAQGKRLDSLDCIRGFSLILMVGYHFFFDLVKFANAPYWLFYNPVFDILDYFFAGIFIMLSGISSRLSRSNAKRGALVLGAALVLTAVTFTIDQLFIGMESLIAFGILHLLGCCMLLFALTRKALDRLPRWLPPFIYIALFLITRHFFYLRGIDSTAWLFPFGIIGPGFYWSDYYPLFPWMFVFFFGTWLGTYLVEGKFPRIFYTFRFSLLAWVGRHCLIVYIIHQPILYAASMLIAQFTVPHY